MKWIVRGRTQFPIDMLRYDSAWPASEQDARLIEKSFNPRERSHETLEVRIETDNPEPTFGRWESFGWTVHDPEDRGERL